MEPKKVPTPLPIGVSSFSAMIEEGYYYVDKTLFIRDVLSKKAAVTLCTRPRRFGKTLNQMMLKCFFENTSQLGGADTRSLFNGLKIEGAGAEYMAHQRKYPVIFLSFKEAGQDTFEESYLKLTKNIASEIKRHDYIMEKIARQDERELFKKLASGKATQNDYSDSLLFLCRCLSDYYGQKPIILIDEYDVPLQKSWVCGFYDEMIGFIRPLLSSALKDNAYLQFAVITGCLRISKESIFTGLNNLDMVTILSDRYDEHFGFTQNEMDAMLEHYGLMDKRQLVKDWYDGYLFGRTEVYNPWSSIKVVADWVENINWLPRPYWSNTSGNDIVRKLIDKVDSDARADLETLMAGGTISKLIHEDITYDEIEKNIDNIWNFLFFTGYLKKVGESMSGVKIILDLAIPNLELQYTYETKIEEWFKEQISEKKLDAFYNAILTGDVETFQKEFSELLLDSISYWDSAESFYHGFMAGILSRLKGYKVKSNRESGHGRCDLALVADNIRTGKAVIFEFKTAKKFRDLPDACEAALKQIEEKNYAAYWEDEGYADIMKYGIGFSGKNCEVKLGV